ncbi:hypothetical protein F5879DRAFT_4169 [Lentinula edodes]|nr:hypothetical protein F5879DRAFT_4169 [Lentinula edodes]
MRIDIPLHFILGLVCAMNSAAYAIPVHTDIHSVIETHIYSTSVSSPSSAPSIRTAPQEIKPSTKTITGGSTQEITIVRIEFMKPHARRLLNGLDEEPYNPPMLGRPNQPPQATLSERIQKLIESYARDRLCDAHRVIKLQFTNAFQSQGSRTDKKIGMYFWGVGGDCVYHDLTGKSKKCEAHLDERKVYNAIGGYILERTGAKWAQEHSGISCIMM